MLTPPPETCALCGATLTEADPRDVCLGCQERAEDDPDVWVDLDDDDFDEDAE